MPEVLAEVAAERQRQNVKWGEQNHPDGTGPEVRPLLAATWCAAVPHLAHARDLAAAFTRQTDGQAAIRAVTWRDILLEEVMEATAESDVESLRSELVQVAAVAVQWIESIDRREVRGV